MGKYNAGDEVKCELASVSGDWNLAKISHLYLERNVPEEGASSGYIVIFGGKKAIIRLAHRWQLNTSGKTG